MIKMISEQGKPVSGIYEFIIDTESEIENLEIDEHYKAGSKIYCIENSKTYMLNGSGAWVEVNFKHGGGWDDRIEVNAITLPPGSNATVERAGTAENPVLNFGIPRGDIGEVSLADLASLMPLETASGSVASFSDGSAVFDAEQALVTLEPVQDLHGYDNPWAGGAGKNLLVPQNVTLTKNGLTLTASEDGKITITGTATANADFEPWSFVGDTAGYYSVVLKDNINGSNTTYWVSMSGVGIVYTGKFATSYLNTGTWKFRINVVGGTTMNLTVYPMVIKGSTEIPYEPYSNICPISGHDSASVVVAGKNLCNVFSDGLVPSISGGALVNGGGARSDYVKAVGGEIYTVSVSNSTLTVYLFFYDSNRSFISYQIYGGTLTVTAPQNSAFMMVRIAAGYNVNTDTCQLELGTTATEYEPYQGQTYTTAFPETVYGGTVDLVSGVLTVDRAMVDLGTLANWQTTSTATADGSQCHYATVSGMATDTANTDMISDRFTLASGKYISQMVEGTMIRGSGNIYVATDVATISGQLVYPLANHQTYQLTPQQIALLTGDNNVWSDSGSIEVKYRANIGLYVDKKISEVNA